MTDLSLGKIVLDDNNQEKKSWSCLRQSCSRSLIVFFSQLFVFLVIIFGCCWKTHLSQTCHNSRISEYRDINHVLHIRRSLYSNKKNLLQFPSLCKQYSFYEEVPEDFLDEKDIDS